MNDPSTDGMDRTSVIVCGVHGPLDYDDVEEGFDGSAHCKFCAMNEEIAKAVGCSTTGTDR